ncbi:MAG TPA: cobalamin-independent methionine synthase II family protein [Candidatus Limnocylindrales bacterium]|nr:cobalamin-independent methionine synthase II family protein [Candidatus Limnocylindrales bacterium]
MRRSDDRILTTHVGSLVRPADLLELAAAASDSPRQHERYLDALQQATAAVVARQAQAGLDIVNDGEYGKSSWANYVLDRLTGFEPRPDTRFEAVWLGRDRFRFRDFMEAEFPRGAIGAPGHACVGPIRYRGHESVRRNIRHLTAALQAAGIAEGFLTAVAPASTGYDTSNEYYADERDYVFAVAEALREEYLEIYQSGLVLQVDDAVLANMYDELASRSPERYREWAELRVEALNHALRGIPEDRVRYHVCFGSWHVPHVADAPLEAIVELVLKVRAGAYSVEAANVRHEHEWRVWQSVKWPSGKILIPGVVTHHTTTVEHPRLVADRIVRFARCVGREHVIAGTDCGFAQVESIRRVHPQVMWAKLEALAEGARLASKELWG